MRTVFGHTLAVSACTSSLSLFLQSLQKDRHSVDLLELSNSGIQVAQDQRKATKECDQKIFLINEQRELSQLNEALFRQFFQQSY